MFVFTDGSFSSDPKMSGFGFLIIDKKDNIYCEGGYSQRCVDNNVAEVLAVEKALKYIDDYKLTKKSGDKTINIITDSRHVLKHLDDLRQNDYETELFDNIRDLRYKYKINFFHIKGHNNNNDNKLAYYNNIVDAIAKEQRLLGLERYHREQRKLIQNKLIENLSKKRK